ncbi:MAG: PAS domain S-box protein, partial [Bacteroidota bacterium]
MNDSRDDLPVKQPRIFARTGAVAASLCIFALFIALHFFLPEFEFGAYGLLLVAFLMAAFWMVEQRRSATESRRYRLYLEHSVNPIQVLDAAGSTLFVNPAFERWAGYTRAELNRGGGINVIAKVLGPDKPGRLEDIMNRFLHEGRPWSGNVEVRHRNGAIVTSLLYLSPVLDARGRLLECVGIHNDTTERVELLRKVEESQQKYRNIVESSLDGIVVVQDGRIVFGNLSAARIFAYESVDEMLEIDFMKTVAPASRPFVFPTTGNRAVGEDILSNYEMKGLKKGGKMMDLEVNAKLIDWNGHPAVQASFRDITERKLLEREQALWFWEQEVLGAIDRQLAAVVDLPRMFNAISMHAKSLTRGDWSGVLMFDPGKRTGTWRSVKGSMRDREDGPMDFGPAYELIAAAREPLILHQAGEDIREAEAV